MKSLHYTPAQRDQLPEAPGVYQFYNHTGQLIYVGKAKDLKKRVSSYFNDTGHLHLKTRKMVAQIAAINFIMVASEYEALLLENNLIKTHQPRYNVLLKDGKTYPYLCIVDEPFPRVIVTRQRHPVLGRYFGPFTSARQLEQIQELIHQLYPLRTCTYRLSPENIAKKKFRVCLEYHIGRCLGPCEQLQTPAHYQENINQITELLKGNFGKVKKILKDKMVAAASEKQFAQAQTYKEQLAAIENYQSHSVVVHPDIGETDVIALLVYETQAFAHYLRVSQGMTIFGQTIELQKKLAESDEELLTLALCYFREKTQSKAPQVLSNLSIAQVSDTFTITVPKIGDKKKLLDMALANAFFFQKEALNQKATNKGVRQPLRLLQQDLRMSTPPLHIECFDNSNLQGTHPVASMVCFKNGKPAKSLYRHYHIKSVEGIDDCASIEEVVFRRYQPPTPSDHPLPDLVIIDGGKGQLHAATTALKKAGVYGQLTVIAIAKRLEVIYYPDDPDPLYLSKRSSSLQLLQTIRDEAHRFAVNFHRQVRDKTTLRSELDDIPGVGPQTIQKLLAAFPDMAAIKNASLDHLAAVVGKHKAAQIHSTVGVRSPLA